MAAHDFGRIKQNFKTSHKCLNSETGTKMLCEQRQVVQRFFVGAFCPVLEEPFKVRIQELRHAGKVDRGTTTTCHEFVILLKGVCLVSSVLDASNDIRIASTCRTHENG